MPCIETLSDVVRFYIEMIAEKSVNQAETSGRAVVGLQDVLSVLGNTVGRYLNYQCNQAVIYNNIHTQSHACNCVCLSSTEFDEEIIMERVA